MEETLESVLKACLRSRFGYDSFRGQQLQVMLHLLHGRDAFCLMATGGGKSLIYQLPAIALRDKGVRVVSVVISPLIAIMQDQVESLKAVGVSAVALGGSATHQEEQRAMEGDYPIVFASPEKAAIWQHGFKRLMETSRVISLAVDGTSLVSPDGGPLEHRVFGLVLSPSLPPPALVSDTIPPHPLVYLLRREPLRGRVGHRLSTLVQTTGQPTQDSPRSAVSRHHGNSHQAGADRHHFQPQARGPLCGSLELQPEKLALCRV